MNCCEEMKLFRKALDKKNIAWEDKSEELSEEMWFCRTHFEYNGNLVSVINGFGTYGGWAGANGTDVNRGLLEVMIENNEPVGWLTAESAIHLIFD